MALSWLLPLIPLGVCALFMFRWRGRRRLGLRVEELAGLPLAGARLRWLRWRGAQGTRLGTVLELGLPDGSARVAACPTHLALERDYEGDLEDPLLAPSDLEDLATIARAVRDANQAPGYRGAGGARGLPPLAGEGERTDVPTTRTGYHPFDRRQPTLTLQSGQVLVAQGGQARTLTRAECAPIRWLGAGRGVPLWPLAGLVLELGEGPALVLAALDGELDFEGARQQASPAPHLWVPAVHLELIARALGLGVRRAPPMAPVPTTQRLRGAMFGYAAIGLLLGAGAFFAARSRGQVPVRSCAAQPGPKQELYPRVSCLEARDELTRVAAGSASPRVVVLRPTSLVVDARDVLGPARLTCDGVELPVLDALQADPSGPIVMNGGPHAVLVSELPSGQLRVNQYSLCGNVVGRERRR